MGRRDDLSISVPSYFRCPISLEVMKSPVSLCTGVTYDRTSIQRWLDAGNNTCPATMQLLHTKDLIPNHTLHRLINIWSHSLLLANSPLNSLTCDQATELIRRIEADLRKPIFLHSSLITQNLSRLVTFAAESEENGRFLAAAGGRILPLLVSLIGKVRDSNYLQRILSFCNVVLMKNSEARAEIGEIDFNSSIMIALKEGKLQLRIAAAKFLDLRLELNSCPISENVEIFPELLRLITSSDWDAEAVDVSLNLLTRLTVLKRNRVKLVAAGGVRVLAAALSEAELNASSTEKVLKLLEMASACKEGRDEICASRICVKAMTKKLLKVSNAVTERAVAVLWRLCCLLGEKRAAAVVVESNGMAKILVVLQSNCSPSVRQMCADLLRVFGCSSKTTCGSWYDTKTTHIMPF